MARTIRLLGGQVRERAEQVPRDAHDLAVVGIDRAGEAEVHERDATVRGDEDVSRLEIAMNYAALVSALQHAACLHAELRHAARLFRARSAAVGPCIGRGRRRPSPSRARGGCRPPRAARSIRCRRRRATTRAVLHVAGARRPRCRSTATAKAPSARSGALLHRVLHTRRPARRGRLPGRRRSRRDVPMPSRRNAERTASSQFSSPKIARADACESRSRVTRSPPRVAWPPAPASALVPVA